MPLFKLQNNNLESIVPKDFKEKTLQRITEKNLIKIFNLKFVQGFLRIIQQNQFEIDPVSRLIQFVDPKSSLGCYIEELLARGLSIPVSQVVINNMDSFPKRDELSSLIRQGVDIPAARLSQDQNEPLLLVTQLPLM